MLARPADGGLRLRRNAGASRTVGFDHDVPRNRSRELAQVSRGVAQPLGRQGKRVAHRLPGDRYRGVTRRPSLVRDGGRESERHGRDGDQGPYPLHRAVTPSNAAVHSAPMKRDIR